MRATWRWCDLPSSLGRGPLARDWWRPWPHSRREPSAAAPAPPHGYTPSGSGSTPVHTWRMLTNRVGDPDLFCRIRILTSVFRIRVDPYTNRRHFHSRYHVNIPCFIKYLPTYFFGWKQNLPKILWLMPLKKSVFFTWTRIRIGKQSGSGSVLEKNLDLDPRPKRIRNTAP